MTDKIKLVQGDTRPRIIFTITDENTGDPVNVAGATVVLKFRAIGEDVKEVIPCYLAPGKLMPDGTINTNSPFDVAGVGGRVFMDWTADSLDEAGEFQGEIEVTFPDNTVQTSFELLRFRIREQF